MIKTNTYNIISLGCAKNTVDSDSMSQLLDRSGFQYIDEPSKAQVVIVNTCGFIAPARHESIQTLKQLASRKRKGQLLIAAGCLTQRYAEQVAIEVPGLDGILGTRRWMDIVQVVQQLRDGKAPQPNYHLPSNSAPETDTPPVMRSAVQGASAYLKIADGCRRPCAFCSIPLIKGAPISRPIPAIIADARQLAAKGVKEIILIAQDTTDYGFDLGMKDGLSQLLEALASSVPQIPWIRIMYAYPGYVTDRLIDLIASYPQILPYLDMPLQHAHPEVLKRMGRPANITWVYRTIEKMRQQIPNLVLRTTFIVGYPGETEQEFETLLNFMKEIRFDRVGAFQFSFEPGTASESLGDPIPPQIKQERWERLMSLQQSISLQINQSLIGKTLPVLVEGQAEVKDEHGKPIQQQISIGRSYRDAPEIDGLVLIEGEAPQGEIIPVKISGALPYDLQATMLNQPIEREL
ncbi:MAG: 30S ribosomal protein S12 methylthiotransferase RimO [Anaerolineales bacterium]